MKVPITEFDLIFLSYDEPNCEENYADLLSKAPWAQRVHGVEGSDSAHKACAELSETDRVVIIDGDNIVDEKFFDIAIDFDKVDNPEQTVFSWGAKNVINGLEYGNGGIKCWPKQAIFDMKTHEHAEDDTNQVDFCWGINYHQMANSYCITINNGSALQAWRAGFREGVKMSLDRGLRVTPGNFESKIWHGNFERLLVWQSVGMDTEYGAFAIYGARLGCYMTMLTDWNFINVRDFSYLTDFYLGNTDYYHEPVGDMKSPAAENAAYDIGKILRRDLHLPLVDFNAEQSAFFKRFYRQVPRGDAMTKETD